MVIKNGKNTNVWTNEEDIILKNNYKDLSDSQLVKLLPNRTKNSIYARRHQLGLNKKNRKLNFSDVIVEMDKRNYTLLSCEDEYKDVHSKMKYICPYHKDKGVQYIDLGHLRQGQGCTYCGREKTISSKIIDIDKEYDRKITESKGLEYIDTYRDNGKLYISFICPKHKEIGKQSMYRWYLINHAVGCKFCHGHSLPESYVIKKIKEVNPDIELLEPYDNMTKRIKCRCKKHNYVSTKSVQEILLGRGCKYCGIEKLSNYHLLSNEEIQQRVSEKHPHIKLLKYDGINSKETEWLCTRHNKKFKKVLSTMLKSEESGCDICYKEHMNNLFSYTTSEFENRLKSVHPELEVHSEYLGFTDPITIYCTKHDYEFQKTPAYILKRTSCCPKSFKTYKEEMMCSLIESWGYSIERQHSIDGCYDSHPLKFDCYLTDFNTVCEYDGENHYYPVQYGTQSWDDAVKKHEYTKAHDEIKNEFCKRNGINMIRVPYFEFENMKFFLFDKFVELGIIEEIKIS